MNIKKIALLTSLAGAAGATLFVYILKSLQDAFEFDLEDEEELNGEV